MKKVFYFFIFNTVLLISSCAKESPFVDNSIGTESMPEAPVIPEDQGNISDDLFNGNTQQVSYSKDRKSVV